MGMASRGGSGLRGPQAVESSQRAHREGVCRGTVMQESGPPPARVSSSLGEGPGIQGAGGARARVAARRAGPRGWERVVVAAFRSSLSVSVFPGPTRKPGAQRRVRLGEVGGGRVRLGWIPLGGGAVGRGRV